jgi:2-C-methyl-D-erythritol 2,4-cyclodiphosphate synthase
MGVSTEGITSIEWTLQGKVRRVLRDTVEVVYRYDPLGNRLGKQVRLRGQTHKQETYWPPMKCRFMAACDEIRRCWRYKLDSCRLFPNFTSRTRLGGPTSIPRNTMATIRVGQGYDVHQLQEGWPFWLGGIQVPHTHGAVGHSDADVLIHVICDALLGAANMRDIGYHFSDQDPQYKGIDSKILLREVVRLIGTKGYRVGNVDSTVCLQRPKVNPHIPAMKACLAEVMGIAEGDISIKATTTERLGFVGREEGVAAYATVLIEKI